MGERLSEIFPKRMSGRLGRLIIEQFGGLLIEPLGGMLGGKFDERLGGIWVIGILIICSFKSPDEGLVCLVSFLRYSRKGVGNRLSPLYRGRSFCLVTQFISSDLLPVHTYGCFRFVQVYRLTMCFLHN